MGRTPLDQLPALALLGAPAGAAAAEAAAEAAGAISNFDPIAVFAGALAGCCITVPIAWSASMPLA